MESHLEGLPVLDVLLRDVNIRFHKPEIVEQRNQVDPMDRIQSIQHWLAICGMMQVNYTENGRKAGFLKTLRILYIL